MVVFTFLTVNLFVVASLRVFIFSLPTFQKWRVTPAPPHARQIHEEISGQNMTQNTLKQCKLDSFGAMFLFIFLPFILPIPRCFYLHPGSDHLPLQMPCNHPGREALRLFLIIYAPCSYTLGQNLDGRHFLHFLTWKFP